MWIEFTKNEMNKHRHVMDIALNEHVRFKRIAVMDFISVTLT